MSGNTILVTGASGQVGREIARRDWGQFSLLLPDRAALDISSPTSVNAYILAHSPVAIINCAAHTAVDRAEDEVGLSFAANALGPALLADAARTREIPLLQVSTDYVFSGDQEGYYSEEDAVGPNGVYGASKLAGELAALRGCPRAIVLRVAWVVSAHGHNFIKTMRRLAETRREVTVVADQIGCPTSAADIADAIHTIVERQITEPATPGGIYHFVNAGEASWCDFANQIFAVSEGAEQCVARPIRTVDYPTRAQRPANSRLATRKITEVFAIRPRPWQTAITEIITELDQSSKKDI